MSNLPIYPFVILRATFLYVVSNLVFYEGGGYDVGLFLFLTIRFDI